MKPAQAVNIDDLRRLARRRLPRFVFDYIDGGAEDEAGLARNVDAWRGLQLVPRYLVDVSRVEQSTMLFGQCQASAFGIGPTGLAGFARPGADLMLARAAAQAGIPFVLSGAGTASVEAVARAVQAPFWYQLYVSRDAAITADLIRRAREAGVETLMLTVDVPVHGKRERDIRNGFVPPVRPSPALLWDMLCHPRWLAGIARHGLPRFENWAPYAGPGASATAIAAFFTSQIPFTQTWRDLESFRQRWPGRLVIKGILHPDDARRAVALGVDGIVVSNHGGRQLDCAPTAVEAFPALREAVGPGFTLMLDGGVRRGADVVRARALGADFVFLGRASLFGVAAGGEQGAAHAIDIIKREIDQTLAQTGSPQLAQLGPDCLAPPAR